MTADAIITTLSSGPATTADLVKACGYDVADPRGRSYVTTTLCRLARRGWRVVNLRPRGSQRGAVYVLASRPVPAPRERNRCRRCDVLLAADHGSDLYCSPCNRALLDAELACACPDTLFDLEAAIA